MKQFKIKVHKEGFVAVLFDENNKFEPNWGVYRMNKSGKLCKRSSAVITGWGAEFQKAISEIRKKQKEINKDREGKEVFGNKLKPLKLIPASGWKGMKLEDHKTVQDLVEKAYGIA